MVCSKYDRCIIPLHGCLFFIIGFHLPFKKFKIDVEGSDIIPDLGDDKALEFEFNFSKKYGVGIHTHDNDPLVITMRYDE